MKRIFLFMLAALMLTSCDNFKGSSKEDDTEEESPKKKKKKKKVVEEDEDTDDEDTDEETTRKKKKTLTDDDDTGNEENDNTTGTWTTAQRVNFMEGCVAVASKNNPAKAKSYCACMMGKIEPLYPDYDEFNRTFTSEEATRIAKNCQ